MTKKHHDSNETEIAAPKPQTFLDRLRIECDDVGGRLTRLEEFIDTQQFQGLEQEERERLQGQKLAMRNYHGILVARITYHEAKGI